MVPLSRVQSVQAFYGNVNSVFPPTIWSMWSLFRKLSDGDYVGRSHSFLSIAGAATLVFPTVQPIAIGVNALWGVFSLFATRSAPVKIEEIISELKRTQELIATHEAEQKRMLVEMQSKGERIESGAERCLQTIRDYRSIFSQEREELKIFETRLNALALRIQDLLSQAKEILLLAVKDATEVLGLLSGIREVHEKLEKKAEKVEKAAKVEKIDEEEIRRGISQCKNAQPLSLSVHTKIIRLCDLMTELEGAHNAMSSLQRLVSERQEAERSRLEKFCSEQEQFLKKQAEEGKLIASSAAERAEKCQQAQDLIRGNLSDLERLRQEVNRFYRNAALLLSCSVGLCFFRLGGIKISLILSGGLIALTVAQFFRAQGSSKEHLPV